MKNLKVELFNFKKSLDVDQDEICGIVESHMNALVNNSEKLVITSLNEKLKTYTFDKSVKGLLESLNADMEQYQLLYELKHLYNVLNTKNQGELYRQPINVVLQTINLDNDQDRLAKVLNELAIYDWVPEVKLFVHNLTKSPDKKQNLLSGGKAESVYTIVERVEDGYIAFINDAWFLLSEKSIDKVLLEDHVKDAEKLKVLRTLETSLKFAEISESRVDFKISEYLTVGLSTEKKGVLFINDEEVNKETTLESLFNSPIIPIVNKNFYPLLMEVSSNLDKFVELDVVKRVTNLTNPYLENFAFNYKDSVYLYRVDSRFGNSFFKYESASEIVNEMRSELGYDLTFFYENKIDKETIVKRKLEDKERELELKLEDVNFNISKIKTNLEFIKESEQLTAALETLVKTKSNIETEIQGVKELKMTEKIRK